MKIRLRDLNLHCFGQLILKHCLAIAAVEDQVPILWSPTAMKKQSRHIP